MPDLELPSLHLPEAGLYLAAVMFSPRGASQVHSRFVEGHRNSIVKNLLAKIPEGKPLPDSMATLVRAAASGPRKEEVAPAHIINKRNGQPRDLVAGILLLHVLSQGAGGSLEKAITSFSTAAGIRKSIAGRSRTDVIQTWKEFSPAAHLLAIRLGRPDLWQCREHGGRPLSLFLAFAEMLRLAGEAHRAPRSSRGLLDPTETWKVPPWVQLPEVPPLIGWLPTTGQIETALQAGSSGPR